MKAKFKELRAYLKLHDGMSKPKLNFGQLYELFPELTFSPAKGFGSYTNFGEAFEAKCFNMLVSDGESECFMVYREYGDAVENLAYIVSL